MAQNYKQKGAVMPWTNGTGSDVVSGAALLIGVMLCIALGNIADGAEGEVATEEVWEVPKEASLVISQGDQLYWDDTNKVLTKTSTANTACGKAFADAAGEATTVLIKLNA